MSPRMLACPACSNHVLVVSTECPQCGASVTTGGGRVLKTAGAVMLGLTLGTACDTAPMYGLPDTGDTASSDDTADTGDTAEAAE